MAFPVVATNGQLYNTADGRQYKYILADDSWVFQSVQISTPKTNGAATAPPLVTDDIASGYGIGSIWVDVLANKPYIAVDVTVGAAIWVESTPNTKVQAAAPLTPLMGDHYLNTTDGFYYIWNGTAWVDTTAAGSGIKNNFVAVIAPIATNDSGQGYSVGSVWVDLVANAAYTLVDATLTNAVWQSARPTPWLIKATAYTAIAGDRLFVDTTLLGVSITLPATPVVGDSVQFIDVGGSFAVNPLTVLGNGAAIMSLPTAMTNSVSNATFALVYSGAVTGWRVA